MADGFKTPNNLPHLVILLKTFTFFQSCLNYIFCRWNVKRKWKQAVDFQGLGRDEQLDEAYMDELEQQVYPKLFPILSE